MKNSVQETVRHYDTLIEENNDSFRDPEPLKNYMDKWDGQVFIDELKLDKNKTVLEIGVGTGRLAVKVAPLCKSLTGIDISPKTVERAKENLASNENITLICGDFLDYPFKEKFDIIYSSLTFMHIEEKQTAVQKVFCLLKNNSRFILSIDKNQSPFIDMGTRKLKIFPDSVEKTQEYLNNAGFSAVNVYETEFAYIFTAVKA